MKKRERPQTRAERLEELLEAKLDRLRDPLILHGTPPKRKKRAVVDQPFWDYSQPRVDE